MIRLTGIEISDFGRHVYIKQKIDGNIIGLAGKNGEGKTTILQSVELGVTGGIETKDNDPLSAWIRRGTRDGKVAKSSMVALDFETDSRKVGKIVRRITKTTTSRELTIEGMDDGPFSADKKVQKIMMDLLGVDKKALSSTVFIKQGAVDAMFGGKTERREFYTRLLMLGHLAKLADTIDGYRKNVASSVVDLSGVLDEAQNAEREATSIFEEYEPMLAAAHDCTEWITLINRISFLFGDQAAAHENVAKELNLLGSDPTAKIDAILAKNRNHELRIAEISVDRLAHADAQVVLMNRMKSLRDAEAIRECYDELETAKIEYAALVQESDSSVDYHAMATSLQRKIDASVIIAGLSGKESELSFDVQMSEAQYTGAAAAYDDACSKWENAARQATALRNDCTLREKILEEVQMARAGHEHDSACLVCGSNVQDASYLARTVAEAQVSARDAEVKANSLKETSDACKLLMEQARRDLDTKKIALQNIISKLTSAREIVGESTASTDELREQAEEARNKATSQSMAAKEIERIRGVIRRLESLIAGQSNPTDNDIAAHKTLVANDKADCKPWDATLDEEETRLKREVETSKAEVDTLRSSQTRLQASREWLIRTEAELEELCLTKVSHIPADIYIQGRVMTASLADEISTNLRQRQSEYDSLQGARDAARTAMVNAQSRVIETENKIEGQKQRVELASRLERLKTAFKPDGATTDYLDYKFAQVAALASDYLAESGADFTVVASENEPLSFDFIRMAPGEEWLGQSRLSGGQRIRLAVATLRAIHSLVVPNVGLLVLDEPTTHLDTEAKLALAEMLRRIGNEGGLQIIVCDHDPVILDACSSVIEIPA
jgi:exonuclease SbcC